ncbi:hypothetical protein Tsubulata_003072 [Turnera subulata]|uniref:HTH myb-type domain-containing protein n=1 Tax=Turnera subulata TaxID=218843 RepID=A0A9Q0FQT5_9ROSI|nr:hypothetical protein Tsubulata_003072 [Turnera subulata]
MVLHRSLDYRFNGYQAPVVPRASRSLRGKGPIRKKSGDNHRRAFEILASVAGNLLQKGEGSGPLNTFDGKDQCNVVKNIVNQNQESGEQLLKADPSYREICCKKTSVCVPSLQRQHSGYKSNKFPHAHEDLSVKHKLGYYFKGEPEAGSLNIQNIESGTFQVKDRLENAMEPEKENVSEDPLGSNVKKSMFKDSVARDHVPADMKVGSRDNDDNSFDCSQHGTVVKKYRPYIGGREIRNLSVSRHWRVAQNLKTGGHFRTDRRTRPICFGGRPSYTHDRSENIFPIKKRKFYYQDQLSTMDGACDCEDVYNPPRKRANIDNSDPAIGESSLASGEKNSPDMRGCNVKLSIKSFKVPELFIDMPATATVGSLKRTVMEAVTAILGDGLHVGILVQGKRVRDDNKTLLQTGISEDEMHGSLGFMLEPRDAPISSVPGGQNRHPMAQQPGSSSVSPVASEKRFGSHVCTDPSTALSLCPLADNATSDSEAIVAVPAIGTEPLAVVPLNSKSRNLELGQRRIRRPFSVSEVEALVQAVEKLGTGRWRDVKLRAFDNAHHRTYVDLKDKWKTLVHTATITPQQRRGEPVPQELLDRVLAVDAHWSQRQGKQRVKPAA